MEIALAMGISATRVRRTLEAVMHPISLQAPIGQEGESCLGDFIGDERSSAPYDIAAATLLREQIEAVLQQLSERERQILQLRYGLKDGRRRTLEAVGVVFGITHERVRQIEAEALRTARSTESVSLRDCPTHRLRSTWHNDTPSMSAVRLKKQE